MRHSIPGPAVAAALLVASMAAPQASHAAPDACLSAPNGAAPKGQHWYYRLDHANNRKCWYLRDLGSAAVKPAAAPSRHADDVPPTSRPSQASAPQARSATVPPAPAKQAPQAADPWPTASRAAIPAANPPAADAPPVDLQAAAPAQPATAPNAASVWTDAPPPTANSVAIPSAAADAGQNAAVATPEPPPVVADPPVRHAPVTTHAEAPHETHAAAVPVSAEASASSIAQNLFIILLAGLLAGGVFAAVVVLRRRKPVAVRRAASGPRFGSRPEREDGLWLKWPRRERDTQPAGPIQSSMIPQQVRVTRHPAPRH